MDEEELYDDEIERKLKTVSTREELVEFVRLISHGYRQGFEEEQSVADFLDGYAALVRALDSWYRNQSLEKPENPDWNMMARLLDGAFGHS